MPDNKNKRILCEGKIPDVPEKLRSYQQKTLEIIKEFDKKPDRFSTLVNLPTGAGKTKVGVHFCIEALEKGAKILWLADRISLLEQTIKEFNKEYTERKYSYQLICGQSKKNVSDENGIKESSYEKQEKIDKGTNAIFASVLTIAGAYENNSESFRQWIEESQKNGKKLYIVYDEAHHIGANKVNDFFTSLLCDTSKNKDNFHKVRRFGLIGLTATVYRGDRFLDIFNAWFKDGWNNDEKTVCHIDTDYGDYKLNENDKAENNRIKLVDIKDLIKGGDGEEPVLIEPDIIKNDEFKNGKLEDGSEKEEMEYLADRIKKHYHNWGKTIVFVKTVETAKMLKKNLDKENVSCFTYISTDKNNKDNMDKFKKAGEDAQIAIAVNMINEGIDIPDLNTIYLYAPTKSQIILRQRVGRVLRRGKGDNRKKARVIWQYYPDDRNQKTLSKEELKELLKTDFEEKKESEEELKRDIDEKKNNPNMPIPPAMYREPLPNDSIIKENSLYVWMYLEIEKLFGKEAIEKSESIGYYCCCREDENIYEDDVIYVRDVERKGYQQYLRMLQNDWQTLLRFSKNKNLSFEQYAEILNTNRENLLNDIKKICFYLSSAKEKDAKRTEKKFEKRIFVRDEDIVKFFDWFIHGSIIYQEIPKENEHSNQDKNLRNNKLLNQFYSEECEERNQSDKKFNYEAKIGDLRKLKSYIMGECFREKNNKIIFNKHEKEYTDLLAYADGKMYMELMSLKSILREGAIKGERVKEIKTDREIAFIGLSKEGVKNAVKHFNRKCNREFHEDDMWLIASALVNVPNHIYVIKDDAEEYKKELRLKISKFFKFNEGFETQVVMECLMALGYADNDDILRMQCEIFKDNLPKIIQYILYEKVYNKLAEKVNFEKDDKITSTCQNQLELKEIYKETLRYYGVSLKALKDLTPVEDVIYDYRPYLKAVPYYQGIKPEFLCRLVNDIIQLDKEVDMTKYIVDGFGGSGAYTMNSFYKENINSKRIYNDLGIMNVSFYRCLQDKDKTKELKQKIEEVLEEAFSDNINKPYEKFFEKFIEYVKSKENNENSILILEQTIEDREEEYIENYNKRIKKYRSENASWKDKDKTMNVVWFENRLLFMHEEFNKRNSGFEGKFDSCYRSVERYMHVYMLKLNEVYKLMLEEPSLENIKGFQITEVDLALIFLFCNSLSERHFYNDCTIDLIAKFMINYEQWLKWGAECFQDVKIEQQDAFKLLKGKYNKDETIWYLDIPYIGTSTVNYVSEDFDVDKFIEVLSDCKGKYIISSRCNICLPNDEKAKYKIKETSESLDEKSNIEIGEELKEKDNFKKELENFFFYYRFISEDSAKTYQAMLKEEVEKIGEKLPYKYISKEKEPKYVFIPYTKMEEVYISENETANVKKSNVQNNSIISKEYVRRMIAATHFSNIPVETMMTNIELNVESLSVQPLWKRSEVRSEKERGYYVMPTFKTGTTTDTYMTEPAVIIIEYREFIELLISMLFPDKWSEKQNRRENKLIAEYFRKRFEI